MRIGWLLGWAVPEEWFASFARGAFPAAEHVFFESAADSMRRLNEAGPFDWIAGYSLGSLLLLRTFPRPTARVALLAPIFAFPAEANLGGRIPRAQLRQLARNLRRNPTAALADFYARAGLDLPQGGARCPQRACPDALHLTSVLEWGLEQLETIRVEPPLPAGWRAWCGAEDPLLDAGQLCALAPGITPIAGATHHPAALIRAFAKEIAE
jgi:hypothetical protein